ncbi:MAG: hypothetical protein HC831_05705 [Chloroflexia bacterium]|nr:hypothetical protein [Chloroflexia bacterium]
MEKWAKGNRIGILGRYIFAKSGFAFGGILVMGLLAYFGFVANQPQSELSKYGILLGMSLAPSVLALAGTVLLLFYKLNDLQVSQITTELAQRTERDRI